VNFTTSTIWLEGAQRVHMSTKYMIMLSCTRLHVYIRVSLVMCVRSRRLPTIMTSSLHAWLAVACAEVHRKWWYIFLHFSSTPISILNLTISSESQQEILANAKVNARQHCVVWSHSNTGNTIWRTTMFHVVAPQTRNHANFRENSTLQQFKVIQGHRSWCQWKAHMWLPISH